jgi:hypothetical protein
MATDLSKLHGVATRVVHDADFAAQIKEQGQKALQAGPGSPDFEAYFAHFGVSPGSLQGLGTANAAACTCNSNTWITLSTLVTPVTTCCGATTTTTTSG